MSNLTRRRILNGLIAAPIAIKFGVVSKSIQPLVVQSTATLITLPPATRVGQSFKTGAFEFICREPNRWRLIGSDVMVPCSRPTEITLSEVRGRSV